MVSAVRIEAPAKINLTLEIIGKRSDGYHELLTVFQSVGLSDSLSFDWSATGAELVCSDPDVPADESNLVLKAIRGMEKLSGAPIPVKVTLEKRIPAGAGLGGGSSDAAAVLRVLGEKLGARGEELHALAASLGADVPFFLAGGTALGAGKGEILESLPPFPPVSVVIVKPAFPIATAFAYGKVKSYSTGTKSRALADALRRAQSPPLPDCLTNDFEKFLFPFYPELADIKETFLRRGAAAAQLSGSGSAMFALAETGKDAIEIAEAVKPFGRVWITRT